MTTVMTTDADEHSPVDPTEGRINYMAAEKEKVSITLDADVVAEARAGMDERGFSAYVNDVLRREQQQRRLRQLLDDLDTEYGPVPDEMREEARREWRRLKAEIRAEIDSSSTAEQ